MRLFEFRRGDLPLIVSVPHAGTWVPDSIARNMTEASRGLRDTDWFVPRLYELPGLERATLLTANVSRYVIDLNRPPTDESLYPGQNTTSVCPERHFDGMPIYRDGYTISPEEKARRILDYWRPYHFQLRAALDSTIERFGSVVLLDGHSIASRVPNLFDGQLPDLNFGTNKAQSVSAEFQSLIDQFVAGIEGYTTAVNGRFVGGYITRHYGAQSPQIEAIQLEISQAAYLEESTGHWDDARAKSLQAVLSKFIAALSGWKQFVKTLI